MSQIEFSKLVFSPTDCERSAQGNALGRKACWFSA